MSELRHTVCIEDAGFPGEWLELATFRWFPDAKSYAIKISKADKLGRRVVIGYDSHAHFFRFGAALRDTDVEIIAN